MNVKKYLIVDDIEKDALGLQAKLLKFPFLELTAICPTVEKTVEYLVAETLDLIFLDIKLADQSGLFLLKGGFKLPPVIIITAYAEFAPESYEIGKAADYLVKPFSLERLGIALNRALGLQVTNDSFSNKEFIFLKTGRKAQRFNFAEIDFIEAYGIYSKIHLGKQAHVVKERISALETLLPAKTFCRVHKTYMINITKVTGYDRTSLTVGLQKIPIGLSFRPKAEILLRLFSHDESDE